MSKANNVEKFKKYMRKELAALGDKVRFLGFDGRKLRAEIFRENGNKDKVYWLFEEDGCLVSSWYYVEGLDG
jgi:hypothetical protein